MMQPMPRVPPFDRPATYEDLVKLPDHLVAEIVDGELLFVGRHRRAGNVDGRLRSTPRARGFFLDFLIS
jgi:hypothetical protein